MTYLNTGDKIVDITVISAAGSESGLHGIFNAIEVGMIYLNKSDTHFDATALNKWKAFNTPLSWI